MKIAKKKPVLQHLNQIFSLNVDNRSNASLVPTYRQWRQWIWQTCKNSYKRANIARISDVVHLSIVLVKIYLLGSKIN